jgi:hypothetical protein
MDNKEKAIEKFGNIDFSKLGDIGKLLTLCLKCETKEDAGEVLRQYEKYCDTPQIADSNLGYIFGYCNEEDRKKLYSLFPVSHPVFGTAFGRLGNSSPGDALKIGKKMGDEIKKGKEMDDKKVI